MKIRFTDSVAGERFDYRKGQRADLPDEIAKQFIREGNAEPDPGDVETMTLEAPERAVGVRRRRKQQRGGFFN